MAEKKHRHWYSLLWSTYGPYGPQDKHVHPCVNDDSGHCLAVAVGDGRECLGHKRPHEFDESEPRFEWEAASHA